MNVWIFRVTFERFASSAVGRSLRLETAETSISIRQTSGTGLFSARAAQQGDGI